MEPSPALYSTRSTNFSHPNALKNGFIATILKIPVATHSTTTLPPTQKIGFTCQYQLIKICKKKGGESVVEKRSGYKKKQKGDKKHGHTDILLLINWKNYRLRNAVKRAKAAQALLWKLMEDEGGELVPLIAKALLFSLPLLGVALAAAILEDSVVEVELGLQRI